jgi:hypothetical protein
MADQYGHATFRATIRLGGKTATGIPVPAAVVDGLGSGRRPPVRVTVEDRYTYRTTVASMGGEYMLALSAEHREGAGVAAGDEVDVRLESDTEPREVTVPSDLAQALAGDPAAKAFFGGLSYSRKQWYVLPIEQAKTAETRQRRLDRALGMLREQRTR